MKGRAGLDLRAVFQVPVPKGTGVRGLVFGWPGHAGEWHFQGWSPVQSMSVDEEQMYIEAGPPPISPPQPGVWGW